MKVASAQENINSINRDCLRGGNIFVSLSKKSLFAHIIKFFGDNHCSVGLWFFAIFAGRNIGSTLHRR